MFLFVFTCAAEAKVYWVGRRIIYLEGKDGKEDKRLPVYYHSYIIVIPDDPRETAFLMNSHLTPENAYKAYQRDLEKDFGSGKKGFVIGGYPSDDKITGDLIAQINAQGEMPPTRDFFSGGNANKWEFVYGEVPAKTTDSQFAAEIFESASRYVRSTNAKGVDYNAVRSVLEILKPGVHENLAKNCNALAYSILYHSGAKALPDLGAAKMVPGQRTLLPRHLFKGTEFLDTLRKELVIDTLYQKRKAQELRLVNTINSIKSMGY
jgi:hypothetical protein